nr:anti-sigma factor [Micromonospora sp. DSM 115978]
MPHLDEDRLIFLALGEAMADPAETDHLDSCHRCRGELADLRRVARLGAQGQPLRDLPPPPEHVWQGIVAEIRATESTGIGSTAAAPGTPSIAPTGPGAAAPTNPMPVGPARAGVDGGPAGDRVGTAAAPPVELAQRRRGRRSGAARTLVTAVAAAAIGVVGTLVAVRPFGGEPPAPEPVVVASAPLAAYGDTPPTATGAARVFGDGRLHLHVTGLPASPGYYEVWLINPETMEMFSVGVLGEWPDVLLPLPPTVDLATYSVVDVSAERYDNDTAHSGDSLLRGTLT